MLLLVITHTTSKNRYSFFCVQVVPSQGAGGLSNQVVVK